MRNRLLLTGASGFVGRAMLARVVADGHLAVTAAVRRPCGLVTGPAGREVVVGDVSASTDWGEALAGVGVVVHAAARAHVVHDDTSDSLQAFLACNEAGAIALARQAARAGVRRFVFVSSVKVHGEATPSGTSWREAQAFAPEGAYAVSKTRAEAGLLSLCRECAMELVRVRPPLVYGPGVRANFLALIRAVRCGLPLPLASVDNRRSLVSINNLVDFLVHCMSHPGAAGGAFFVSDGEDLSTPELIRRLAAAMGRHAPLWPVPAGLLRAAARTVRREGMVDRLCGNLQVDISAARMLLGWQPPESIQAGLERVVHTP